MTDKQIQPAPAITAASGVEPQKVASQGSVGAAAYFDRAGILWIALCVILAVGAGHLIPRADILLRPSEPPVPLRLDYSHSAAPEVVEAESSHAVSTAISSQPSAGAISATGEKKVW